MEEQEKSKKVVVVDDSAHIRRFISIVLEAHDFKVAEAASAEEAKVCISEESPELIILDLGLPDQDGLDLLTDIREVTSAPVVVLTVRNDQYNRRTALQRGADTYMTKPFQVPELLEVVEQLV